MFIIITKLSSQKQLFYDANCLKYKKLDKLQFKGSWKTNPIVCFKGLFSRKSAYNPTNPKAGQFINPSGRITVDII